MIIEQDGEYLIVFCPDCEWGYSVTDLIAAQDAYFDHRVRRHAA